MECNKKIDGYYFYEGKIKKSETGELIREITITYLSDGEEFIPPKTYSNVLVEKIEEIRKLLFDYTIYNLNEEQLSRCISFSTIMGEVERIIYGK